MTISTKMWSGFVACAAVLIAGASRPAQAAAGTNSTASSPRFSVDVKDATLMDVLQLVFIAANERNYTIDPAAKSVRVGTLSFKDQPWRDIVRTLTSLNKFRFARTNGVWVVEPRVSSASTNTVFSTSTRLNAKQSDFSIDTRDNAQFGTGSGSGGSGTTYVTVLPTPVVVQSNGPWTIIEPNHTYAGALALFFQGAVVFSTEEQVIPRSWSFGLSRVNNSNGNNNNSNNNSSGNNNSNNNR